MNWKGVMPAITTAFDANLKVDAAFIAQHSHWMVESGCAAMIPALWERAQRSRTTRNCR
jgi:4-hydroxy-tetrahydrodipicolinate synthase